jgi:hypothetical protein
MLFLIPSVELMVAIDWNVEKHQVGDWGVDCSHVNVDAMKS